MPLAKVIPIVNGLIFTVLADAPNPFVQVTFEMLAEVCRLLIVFSALFSQTVYKLNCTLMLLYLSISRFR